MQAQDPISFTTILDASGVDPFPMLQNVWSFYPKKGVKTVFLSIGSSASATPDLILSEQIGCPIHYVPLCKQDQQQWEEVAEILKSRKRDPATAKWSFSEGAEKRWVLPKNVRPVTSLPWWTKGTVQLNNLAEPLQTDEVFPIVEELCSSLKFKEPAVRIDLLKVDCSTTSPGLERSVIAAILDAGFRPSLILVKWSVPPDSDIATTSAAGHLQNTGYCLLSKVGSKFLYHFNDNDMYQTCSWEGTGLTNPLVGSVASMLRDAQADARTKARAQMQEQVSTTANKETSISSVEERSPV